ncbi:hypothetical protein DICVIV_02957 [Dictyocaulus viviparus]|uniref:Uncharacterized protein n=1 Tax=Dictyocaulus viviparus TaxID=29172 RepID=A0A0D8Y218_DICVI|nr:hypothetical protein DICVIV_02957 [Dictyocaulus viviparus]
MNVASLYDAKVQFYSRSILSPTFYAYNIVVSGWSSYAERVTSGLALLFIGLWMLLDPKRSYILNLVDFSEDDPLLGDREQKDQHKAVKGHVILR